VKRGYGRAECVRQRQLGLTNNSVYSCAPKCATIAELDGFLGAIWSGESQFCLASFGKSRFMIMVGNRSLASELSRVLRASDWPGLDPAIS